MALTPAAVRRGVVVLVRLPRDKARPAVVVRSDLLSELSYATVLPITTDLRVGASMRIDLPPSEASGLRAASQVMVDWPQTIRFSDMGQAIGHLDVATMRAITRQMAVVLGIGQRAGSTRRTGTSLPIVTVASDKP
jgi:mRNA interferase MazF